jgi:hypothetical protein
MRHYGMDNNYSAEGTACNVLLPSIHPTTDKPGIGPTVSPAARTGQKH